MTAAILLVGGLGTRLMPLTRDIPKPMLPVAGIPVTEHQILAAKRAGISTLVLATSYLSEVFTPYFGDGSRWGMNLRYAVEKEPLGTGGAIRNAAELLGRDESRVVFNGDVLSSHNLSAQIAFHESKSADVTLHLTQVADARPFGCVPTDAQGRVTAFLEKMENPVTKAINAGCYVFHPSVIQTIPAETVVSVEREIFPALVAAGRPVYGYTEAAYWLDVGTPKALLDGSAHFVGSDFQAAPGCTIDPSARLVGGTAIGKNCVIGADVFIDGAIISDNCTIEAGARIHRSFVAAGTRVGRAVNFSNYYLANGVQVEISA